LLVGVGERRKRKRKWMPVTHTISRPARLVIALAKDQVSTGDILNYLVEIHEAGAGPYRKIFDMRGAHGTIPLIELRRIAKRAASFAEAAPTGPLAIIVATDAHSDLARLFAYAAAPAKRPVRVFRELHIARAWLDSLDEEKGAAG
jgi:hypothetical protein